MSILQTLSDILATRAATVTALIAYFPELKDLLFEHSRACLELSELVNPVIADGSGQELYDNFKNYQTIEGKEFKDVIKDKSHDTSRAKEDRERGFVYDKYTILYTPAFNLIEIAGYKDNFFSTHERFENL